jgi:hypothetical protein
MIAQTGFARAIYPVHAPLDGDVLFAAATGEKPIDPLPASPNSAWSRPMWWPAPSRAASIGNRTAFPRRAAGVARSLRVKPAAAERSHLETAPVASAATSSIDGCARKVRVRR